MKANCAWMGNAVHLHKEICTLCNVLCCRYKAFGPLMISFVEFGGGCSALAEAHDFRLQNTRFFHQFANAPHQGCTCVQNFLIHF